MNTNFLQKTSVVAILAVLAATQAPAADENQSAPEVSFIREVAPILVGKCQSCHGVKTAESNYRLDTFEHLMQPGDFEMAPVTAGDLDDSMVHYLITSEDEAERMPNNGGRLKEAEILLFENWILQGAKFDGQDPAAPIKGQIPRTPYPAAPQVYPSAVPTTTLAFTADGSQLLVGGYHELMVWDSVAGTLLQRVGDIPERVFGLEFNSDRSLLAVAGGAPGVSGELRLIPWENGPKADAQVNVLVTTDDVIFDAAFRPDGKQVAAACSDGSVRVYDVSSGEELLKVENHADWVTDLCYSADGKRIATASRDKTAKVFDAENGDLIATYSGHGQAVNAVAFSPDAKTVLSAGGNVLRAWNVEDSKAAGDFGGFTGEVYAVQANAKTVVTVAADQTARTFTLAERKPVHTLSDHPAFVLSLAWHEPTKRIATGCFDGSVSLWNLEDGSLVKRFLAMPSAAESAAE